MPDPPDDALDRPAAVTQASPGQLRTRVHHVHGQRHGQPDQVGADENRLLAAHDAAARFYRHQLHQPLAAGPRAYLHRRGGGAVFANRRWAIGYAPPNWTAVTRHLRGRGFTDQELVLAGLARRARSGALVDVFRDRIMFGVHRPDGRLVGFVGRAPPQARAEVRRYLNTAQTPLHRKNELLFGLWEQLPALTTGRPLVIVEGTFDVLAVAAAAATNPDDAYTAVAPSGTAITPAHAHVLGNVLGPRQPIIVAFDADTAGTRAAVRAWTILTEQATSAARADQPLLHLHLPDGGDPSAVLNSTGPHGLQHLLEDPSRQSPLIDAVLDARAADWIDHQHSIESRVAAARAIAPLIAAQPPPAVPRLIARMTAQLDLHHSTVTGVIADAVSSNVSRQETIR